MRSYASSLLLLLSLFLGGTVQAAERTSNLRHNDRSGRSTKSDECSIFVVEKPVEADFGESWVVPRTHLATIMVTDACRRLYLPPLTDVAACLPPR